MKVIFEGTQINANFLSLDIGDVFQRGDVEQPKALYVKISAAKAFDLVYERIKDFSEIDFVIKRKCELIVKRGPPSL